MIEAVTLKTAHLFGDALASQARLRYRVFVKDRKLPHTHYEGLEYDEFDTPAATYLIWRDTSLAVRGLIRMLPTSMPYMMQKYWPELCQTRELPVSNEVWELTRVCVDRSYPAHVRLRLLPELLCAAQEFCLQRGARAAVGVTRRHLVEHYIRSGVSWLGEPAQVEGEIESAFWIPVEHLRPQLHCEKFGINSSVLTLIPVSTIYSQRMAA